MGLSDCSKCWDTPCNCGWEYRRYTKEALSKHIAMITQYRSKKEAKEILRSARRVVRKIINWQEKL